MLVVSAPSALAETTTWRETWLTMIHRPCLLSRSMSLLLVRAQFEAAHGNEAGARSLFEGRAERSAELTLAWAQFEESLGNRDAAATLFQRGREMELEGGLTQAASAQKNRGRL